MRPRTKGYIDKHNSPVNKYSKNYNSQYYHPHTTNNDNRKPDSFKNINNNSNNHNNDNNKTGTYNHNLYNNCSNNNNSNSTGPHNNNNEFSENARNKNFESLYNPNDYFEILGIKFHYDDILLICLIFFLYKEGVKDETLFIGLILLLLS